MHVVFQSRGGLALDQKAIDPLTYRTGSSGCSYLLLRSAKSRLKTRPNTDALSACRHSSLVVSECRHFSPSLQATSSWSPTAMGRLPLWKRPRHEDVWAVWDGLDVRMHKYAEIS